MTVHGSFYSAVVWHPTLQPVEERDRWIQRGEIVSIWEPVAGVPDRENWPTWHWTTPGIVRFVIEGATLAQVAWIAAEWRTPFDPQAPVAASNGRMIAKRLWRIDVDAILALEATRLGRPFVPATDTLTITAQRAAQWFKRIADGGRLWNKSAGDVALNKPSRAVG